MAKILRDESSVRIVIESQDDIWFWERRFNVFDFLELFPPSSITEPVPDGHVPPPAAAMITIDTDAGFSFQTDIIRGGFYLRNQTQGTRKWMTMANVKPGDSIVISRVSDTQFRLTKATPSA